MYEEKLGGGMMLEQGEEEERMTRTRGEEEENKVYRVDWGPFGVGGGRNFTREGV
jgi:hypothetical protein